MSDHVSDLIFTNKRIIHCAALFIPNYFMELRITRVHEYKVNNEHKSSKANEIKYCSILGFVDSFGQMQ